MNRLLLSAAAATLATLAAPAAARADFVLDTFNNPTPGTIYQIALLNNNPVYNAPTTAVSAGVARDITVTVSAPLPPNFNSVSGTIGGGIFTMDTDNSSKATSDLKYTLTGAASNLTGTTALALDFLNMNPGNNSTGVALTTPVTIAIATATGTLTRTTTVNGSAVPFTASFALSSFTGTGNLSQVNSITFTLNGGTPQTAVDFALDAVRVKGPSPVPAPPALVLAGVGFVGLVGRARLVRKTA